jgi:hypothetical protein
VQLSERVIIYELFHDDAGDMHYRIKEKINKKNVLVSFLKKIPRKFLWVYRYTTKINISSAKPLSERQYQEIQQNMDQLDIDRNGEN